MVVLATVSIPVFPAVVLGLAFEERVRGWVEGAALPPAGRFGLVVGVLAADILLPVPASAVSTWAGGVLGLWTATAASTLGMTLGAVLGFALARTYGTRLAAWLAGPQDLDRAAVLARQFGPLALLLTRALPILAEACVLLMGTARLSWRRFLPPTVAANVVVSLAYAACGRYFDDRGALSWAVIASGTVPLAVALVARRWRARRGASDRHDADPAAE